jgi:hypothetical protein
MRVRTENTGKRKPWQFMSKFVITDAAGDPYLIRWRLIDTPFGGIFLHKFLRGDSDPYVHDHPWSFVSFVLRGGYTEIKRDNLTRELKRRHIRRINIKRRDDAHYVETLDRVPSWSLVLHGCRRRTWGFYVPMDFGSGVIADVWIEFEGWESYKQAAGR